MTTAGSNTGRFFHARSRGKQGLKPSAKYFPKLAAPNYAARLEFSEYAREESFFGELDHFIPAPAASRRSRHDRRRRSSEGYRDEGPIGASRLSDSQDHDCDLCQGHTRGLIAREESVGLSI
jgi:hypothetical protein